MSIFLPGTHWIHEILSKLLYNDDDARLHRKEASTFLELMPDISELESLSSPRILYTHLPVHYLPEHHITKGGKTIHVIRDPRDVVVSAFHHFLKEPLFKDYFNRDWGDHLSDVMSGSKPAYFAFFTIPMFFTFDTFANCNHECVHEV